MALDEDLADRMRAVLAGTGTVREVRMFGGLCFMLNGNMVSGTSRRGLLVRVGKDRHAQAFGATRCKAHGDVGTADGGLCLHRPAPARRARAPGLARARSYVREHPAAKASRNETRGG